MSQAAQQKFIRCIEQASDTGEDWCMNCQVSDALIHFECQGFTIKDHNGNPSEIVIAFRESERPFEAINSAVTRHDVVGTLTQQIHGYATGSILLVRIDNHRQLCRSIARRE